MKVAAVPSFDLSKDYAHYLLENEDDSWRILSTSEHNIVQKKFPKYDR